MMRVLHYVWAMEFGGIEKLVLDLAAAQRQRPGLNVSLLVGRPGGRMMSDLEASGIPYRIAGLSGGGDLSPHRYRSILSEMDQADVIHLHTFTPLVAAAACRSKAAVVYTEHGNFGFGRRLRVTDRVNRRLLKLFLNRCTDFVSFNSVFTQGEAEHRYGLAAVSRDVVYNGIVTAVTVPPAYEDLRHALKHAFVVGTTSRFAGFKRIDRLIRAFAGLARSHADVRLLLVGDGPLRQELEALCAEHGILDKTVFTGYVAAARACQAVMDVCVFPSQGEPFGIAAVEALAAGKPAVVMNDGGGLLEIVQGVEPGDVVDDEAGLAARLEFYYARRERDPGMPGRRKEYAARFSIEAMEQRFFSEYSKLR